MAQSFTDILMKIEDSSGPIAAEGMSEIDGNDDYTQDFKKGLFFEIEDLDVGIGLEDTDSSSASTMAPPKGADAKTIQAFQAVQQATQKRGGKFSTWTQSSASSGGSGSSPLFPVQMDEVGITRQLDRASPLLFQKCFLTQSFVSATVVMRKAGDLLYGPKNNIASMPFLRIDFTPVLITSINWDVAEVVKEKLKFVCRDVKVQYRPQNNDGSAGKNVPTTAPLTLVKKK